MSKFRMLKALVPSEKPSSASASVRLPPRPVAEPMSAAQACARTQARERRDALIRGVTSIADMRDAIRHAARSLPAMDEVPRIGPVNGVAFHAHAVKGLPIIVTGLVNRWPLSSLNEQTLRERYSGLPVRARVGDYVTTAFAPDRAMQDMSMLEYLELVATGMPGLPPYLGNLELRELNSLCHWPAYFEKAGPPRFWLGPQGTVTPLHCDYDDNLFAQIWGSKRIFLSPPHHDEFLYATEANAVLFGSPFDPEAPDFERYPLARQASIIACVVGPGELLYVPAGWYHKVCSLTFSLSANRWARGLPLALAAHTSLQNSTQGSAVEPAQDWQGRTR
jgi:hypothetical protein